MKVKLLTYTPNPDEVVSVAGKLCYSSVDIDDLIEKQTDESVQKFIAKLVDYSHFSPFEHVSFTFAVEGVSRALLAQITRHRIASFSVKSQRYVNEGNFNYIIPERINKLGQDAIKEYEFDMQIINEMYNKWHDELLKAGCDKKQANEDARSVLPQATETKMIFTMNARELMHFFNLRCCNRSQDEIRKLANSMLIEVKRVSPLIFKKAGKPCLRGKCPEGEMTCIKEKV